MNLPSSIKTMSETDVADDVRREDAIINSMCLTWRHDFGLPLAASGMMGSGMTEVDRECLRRQMRQIYRHHVLPAILAERDRCAKVATDYGRYQKRAFGGPLWKPSGRRLETSPPPSGQENNLWVSAGLRSETARGNPTGAYPAPWPPALTL